MTEEQENLTNGLRKDAERALKLLDYDDRLVLVYYLRRQATRGVDKYDNYGAGMKRMAGWVLGIIDELGVDSRTADKLKGARNVEVRRAADSGQ